MIAALPASPLCIPDSGVLPVDGLGNSVPRQQLAAPEVIPLAQPQPWAFTLIEVCIAMAVAMLILSVAVLSVTGLQDEQRLKETAAQIEASARESLLKAVAGHRTVQMPIASLGGGSVEVKRYGEKEFRKADKNETWEFDPTGICEPIEVRIVNADGTIELGFDPLTACVRKKNITVKG